MATPLDRDPYVSLLSYKRNGSGVETAVWAAPLDGKLVVFTLKDSFKVKRIRRNPKVRVAKCGVAGKLLGPWHDGTCVLVTDPAHEARAYDALNAKYGWQMRLGTLLRSLFGGLDKRCVLEIALDA
ncbi:MAG: PPOX class F420-dependent oxidoreductase [Deltaproteobacteria bacterium]|nr:PPOX class F420-dependent oxidoreductase [Deltaproteobacteria bacterium]